MCLDQPTFVFVYEGLERNHPVPHVECGSISPGVNLHGHRSFSHELVSDRNSQSERWTDIHNMSMRVFLIRKSWFQTDGIKYLRTHEPDKSGLGVGN